MTSLPTAASPISPLAAVPIAVVPAAQFEAWLAGQDGRVRTWLTAMGFTGEAGTTALVPGAEGALALVVQGAEDGDWLWAVAGLPESLPPGDYRLDAETLSRSGAAGAARLALGWSLGRYGFTRYKPRKKEPARLLPPDGADLGLATALGDGLALARDLINTPAEDLGPAELAGAARALAERHGATIEVIPADELLARNYPMIHAVGRASTRPPCLIDIRWGDPAHPKVTLVGKGVCFDSGGLDIKPASAMKLMKKDMGGAATVLGLAHAVMATGLPIRLRVLVPAVENAVAGNAFRPMDVFRTRKGLTVEIGDTDAEGRLILADALAEACVEKPDLLIDMATLTGAARVALGQELPALFSNDDALAAGLLAAGTAEDDSLWRLPLWPAYKKKLKSRIADLNSAPEGGMGGAITAALFLEAFVEPGISWAHIDTFGWNAAARPGRPEGGEGLALRALYRLLQDRFGR
jgi:leucyl aminopeptidase